MKSLKETLTLTWKRRIEALHFFVSFVSFMVSLSNPSNLSAGGLKCQHHCDTGEPRLPSDVPISKAPGTKPICRT